MRGCLFSLFSLAIATAAFGAPNDVVSVAVSEVLPLALEDAFQVVKVLSQTLDPKLNQRVVSPMQKGEIDRRYFGAINKFERQQREGNYYTVHWKAPKGSALTVRLEYRQQKLGTHVQALETQIAAAGGSGSTEFSILGDDYYQDGAVVAWRVLLIQQGRIVGLQQSFLW